MQIKSIEPVRQTTGWGVRVRTTAPATETVLGARAGYTLAQAQQYAQALRRDAAHHGVDAMLAGAP